MKKILAVVLLAFALGANAFWNNNNNTPWSNGSNNYNGYQEDNGMFGYNPYDFWDPRWYMEEMSNMVDEFDDEFSNNNYNGYGYNPYNNGPWNRTAAVAPTKTETTAK